MQIQVKQHGQNSSYRYLYVEVGYYKTCKGHEVYKEVDDFWLYVCINGNWEYFADMREVRRFINNLVSI